MTRCPTPALGGNKAVQLGRAAVATGLLLIVISGEPVAHADDDPLDSIKGTIVSQRLGTSCPPLNYSETLERAAQFTARNSGSSGTQTNVFGYPGEIAFFVGTGDPKQEAIDAIVSQQKVALSKAVGDCFASDYGVGFNRVRQHRNWPIPDDYTDYVVFAIGTPPMTVEPMVPVVIPSSPPTFDPLQPVPTLFAPAPDAAPPTTDGATASGGDSGDGSGSTTNVHHQQ